MPVSPLAILRNPEIAHIFIEIGQLFQVTKSKIDDENTFKSALFAFFCSVVTEVQYSSLTFFSNLTEIQP